MNRHIFRDLRQQISPRRDHIKFRGEPPAVQVAKDAEELTLAAAAGHFPNREENSFPHAVS
jgi:hypothetical protein